MKAFNKLFSLVVASVLVFSLAGCGDKEESKKFSANLNGTEIAITYVYKGDKVLKQSSETKIQFASIGATTKEDAARTLEPLSAKYKNIASVEEKLTYTDTYAQENVTIDMEKVDFKALQGISGINVSAEDAKKGITMAQMELVMKAAGFKEGAAYSNGKVVQEVGGGICQVSSTLYNAVLYANLEIVERYNHGFAPSYVKPGLDATVSWGGPDFKFKNNRNYPIRIRTNTSGKKVRIYIYGLKTDNDYKVVLDAQYVSSVPFTTTYQKDSSLASGQSKVIQSGSNGCKTVTYKYLYDKNGTLVSSECLSRDTYNPHNKIIAVGY